MTAHTLFDLPQRIQEKIMVEPMCGCWIWIAARNRFGYGIVNTGTHAQSALAHRFIYGLFGFIIPDSHELDHLCRLRCCVNPKHIEPVVHEINVSRGIYPSKTHCRAGHPYAGDNLYVLKTGRGRTERRCKLCMSENSKRYLQKRRAA